MKLPIAESIAILIFGFIASYEATPRVARFYILKQKPEELGETSKTETNSKEDESHSGEDRNKGFPEKNSTKKGKKSSSAPKIMLS